MDDAHAGHLVHVGLGEFIPEEEGHQGHHPAMLGHGFVAAAGGVAMAGGVLEALGGGEDIEKGSGFHMIAPFLKMYDTIVLWTSQAEKRKRLPIWEPC